MQCDVSVGCGGNIITKSQVIQELPMTTFFQQGGTGAAMSVDDAVRNTSRTARADTEAMKQLRALWLAVGTTLFVILSLTLFVGQASAAAPVITVTDDATGYTTPERAKMISAADDDSGTTTMKWKLLSALTACEAASMTSGTTSYTENAALMFQSESDNGQKVCFSSTNDEGTPETGYAASGVLGGIDVTHPTVSTVKYYSSSTFNTANEITGSPDKATNDKIYTHITFSENVKNVVASGSSSTVRPQFSYQFGGASVTGYDVVAHSGTLASGDCKAKSGDDTSEYTCLLTIGSGDVGAFNFNISTNTSDIAGNRLGTAYAGTGILTANRPSGPTAIAPLSDTGSSNTDNITKEFTGVKVTMPSSATVTAASRLQAYRYSPGEDGSCAVPSGAGTEDGWTLLVNNHAADVTGTYPTTANYDTVNRIWNSSTFSQPPAGKYCVTARYDLDGTGTAHSMSGWHAGTVINLDTAPPVLGTITDSSTKAANADGNRYLKTGDTVTLTVNAIDMASSPAPPTVKLRFGSGTIDRVMSTTSTAAPFSFTYDISGDTGVLGYQITNFKDIAGNTVADQVGFTNIATVIADTTSPSLGTIADATVTTAHTDGKKYLKAGDTVTLTVNITDVNEVAPTVALRFGTGTADRAMSTSSTSSPFSFTYDIQSGDTGALKYKVTDIDDKAGNGAADQSTFTTIKATHNGAQVDAVIADTTAPSAPTPALNEDTGSTDGFTNNARVDLTGLESGATWEYRLDLDGDTNSDDFPNSWTAGTNTFIPASAFTGGDGIKRAQVRQYDIAQNVSAASAILSFTLDTTPPAAPTNLDLDAADDSCADFNGVSGCDYGTNDDNTTNQTTGLTIGFSGEQYAVVNILKTNATTFVENAFGSQSSPIPANGKGSVTANITGDAAYTFKVTQTDRAGNTSAIGRNDSGGHIFMVIIDTSSPDVPLNPDLDGDDDTGVSSTDNLTNKSVVDFIGIAAGAGRCSYIAQIAPNNERTGQSTHACASGGEDSYTNTTEREETFKVIAYDEAGNSSESAGSLKVRFDRSITEATLDLKPGSDSGYSTTDDITNDATPAVTLASLESSAAPTGGTGKAKVTVNQWVDANGDSTIDLAELTEVGKIDNVSGASQDLTLNDLGEGVHKLVTVHTDDAGNEAITTVSKTDYNATNGTKGVNVVIVDTTPPEAPTLPDLAPTLDTHGAYPNHSKNGTDHDDITYNQDLLFFTEASDRGVGDGSALTDAALTREQHHLLMYEMGRATHSSFLANNQSEAHNGNVQINHANPTFTQEFTTGSAGEYFVTELYVIASTSSGTSTATIGNAVLGTQTLGAGAVKYSHYVFSGSTVKLLPNTTYTLTISNDDSGAGLTVQTTNSTAEVTAGAGWSIADGNGTLKMGLLGNAVPATPATGTTIGGSTHRNPVPTAVKTIQSQSVFGESVSSSQSTKVGQKHTHRFAGAAVGTEDSYHVAAKQKDAAGNISAYSPTLAIKIDRKKPNEVPGELVLHYDSDTGISQTDRRTANLTPVFISEFPREKQLEGQSSDPDFQVDFYEIWRTKLSADFETTDDYSYPSSTSSPGQASFNLIDNTAGATSALNAFTEANDLFDIYDDGVSVRIIEQMVEEFNVHYGYKMIAVDVAGNIQRGVDQSSPELLVPPPTPKTLNLYDDSDTGISNSDDLTKSTTLEVSSNYSNQTLAERQGQAAQNLRTIEVGITPSAGTGLSATTTSFTRPADGGDGNGFEIPSNESANLHSTTYQSNYSIRFDLDLPDIFSTTAEDFPDGTYTITFTGINHLGERGASSDPLAVVIDTTPPVFDNGDLLVGSNIEGRVEGVVRYMKAGDTVSLSSTMDEYKISTAPVVTLTIGDTERTMTAPSPSVLVPNSLYNFEYYTYDIQAGDNGTVKYTIGAITDDAGNVTPAQEVSSNLTDGRENGPTAVVADTDSPPGIIIRTSVTEDVNGSPVTTNTFYALSHEQVASEEGVLTSDGVSDCSTAPTTTYLQGTGVTATDPGRCFQIQDRALNKTTLHTGTSGSPSSDVRDLFDGFKFHPDDNTGTADLETLNTSPRFTGTTIPGVTATFSFLALLGDRTVATTTIGSANYDRNIPGLFTTAPVSLPEGVYTVDGAVTMEGIEISSSDLGGGTTFTIDTTMPSVSLALTTPSSSPGKDTTPTLTVTTEIEATVSVHKQPGCIDAPLETAVTLSGGATTHAFTLSTPLTDGVYSFYGKSVDVAGNAACTDTALEYVLDTVSPVVTVVQVGSGATAQYVATAQDSTATTARYKDSAAGAGNQIASTACTANTDTSGAGWANYTGTLVKSYGDTAGTASAGLCVVFTDAAGNKAAQHIVDGGTYTSGMGGFAISNDTGRSATDFITNNPSQSVSAVTVPGSSGSIILTDKSNPSRVITLPFGESDYSESEPSRFSVSTTIPEGTYAVTGTVTIEGSTTSNITLRDPLIVDMTPITRPDFTRGSLVGGEYTGALTQNGFIRSGVIDYIGFGVMDDDRSIMDTDPTAHTLTVFGTEYPCTAANIVNHAGVAVCDTNYTIAAETPQGPITPAIAGVDLAGNAYSYAVTEEESDANTDLYAVDTIAPVYTVSASRPAGKPGAVIAVTVDATDDNDVLLNGKVVDDENQLRVSIAGEIFSLPSLPGTFNYTIPDDAIDGQRTITLPLITDRAGNETSPSPQNIFFVDTGVPTVSGYLFSNSGTSLSVSAKVSRNNHGTMPGDEGVTFSFTGNCASFPTSPVFTDPAQSNAGRYSYTITISRGTYPAESCSLIVTDAAGNTSDPALSVVPIAITASRSGGGGGGGGGGVGVIRYDADQGGGPPLPEQVGDPLPPEPTRFESPPAALTRDLTIGSQGDDVRQLQQYLNSNGCPVSDTGAGSIGQESTYFGSRTQQAVICYQQKYDINPPQGYVGPLTRAHINARISPQGTTTALDEGPVIIDAPGMQARVVPRSPAAPSLNPGSATPPVSTLPTLTPATAPTFTPAPNAGIPPETVYSTGDRHPDIQEAQRLLNERTSCPVAITGAGSRGQETTYFGSRTAQAIRCYQRQEGLTPTGTLTRDLLSRLRGERQPQPEDAPEPQPASQEQPSAQPQPAAGDTGYQSVTDPYTYTPRSQRSFTAPSL